MRDVLDRVRQLGIDVRGIAHRRRRCAKCACGRRSAPISRGLPAETPHHLDTSAIGAALLAAKAAGLIADIGQTVVELNPIAQTALPLARHREAYENAYQRYRQLFCIPEAVVLIRLALTLAWALPAASSSPSFIFLRHGLRAA